MSAWGISLRGRTAALSYSSASTREHTTRFHLNSLSDFDRASMRGRMQRQRHGKAEGGRPYPADGGRGEWPGQRAGQSAACGLRGFLPFPFPGQADRLQGARHGLQARHRFCGPGLDQLHRRRREWTTVGVSTDVVEASWIALVDSIEYKLIKDAEDIFKGIGS